MRTALASHRPSRLTLGFASDPISHLRCLGLILLLAFVSGNAAFATNGRPIGFPRGGASGLLESEDTAPSAHGTESSGILQVAKEGSLAASAEHRSLILVTDPAPALLGDLLSDDILVVQNGETYLLVVGTPSDLEQIVLRGGSARILDPDTFGKTYYIVISPVTSFPGVLAGARVLHEIDSASPTTAEAPTHAGAHSQASAAIIEASPEEAAAMSARGAEIARVFFRPVRPARAAGEDSPSGGELLPSLPESPVSSTSPTAGRAIDPWVQAQVDLVSGPAIDATVLRLQNFLTRYAGHDSCYAAADWIAETLRSYGIEDVSLQPFDSQLAPNVVAVIPGAGTPEEQIVIGGHYDSYTSNHANCPGADDNASGTAGVLECARVLAQGTYDRTIVIVAYGGEELGLLGSEGYAQAAALRGDDIVASIAVDMIGYVASGDTRDLDIISNSSSEWLRTLVIDTAAEYVPATPSVPGSIPSGASSDHYSFWQAGYDAVLFFEDSGNYSPYIHTTSDVVGVSYNAPDLALDSVRILTAVTATLAGPFELAIQHDPLPNTEESGDDYYVEATVRAAGELDLNALFVHVLLEDDSFTLPLTPTGEPDVFEGWIPAQPPGTFVEYYIEAADTDGNHATDPSNAPLSRYRFFVGRTEVVWADDFESDLGWTVGDPSDNATTGIWTRVDPNGTWSGDVPVQPEDDHTDIPGVLCFVTGDAGPGGAQGDNDVDGGRTTLLSPLFDLTQASAAWVSYHRWYVNDTGASPLEDTWRVELSNDDGGNWQPIEMTSSSFHGWMPVDIDISSVLPLTSAMRLRFIAADEGSGSIVEAAIDDVAVRVFAEDSSEVDPDAGGLSSAALALLGCTPNPFTQEIRIRLTLPASDTLPSLTVHDATGRRIVDLGIEGLAAGAQTIRWNARDDRGKVVPSGVYFLRLTDGAGLRVARILRLR